MVERVDIQKTVSNVFSTTRIKKVHGQSNNRHKKRFNQLLQKNEKDSNEKDVTMEIPENQNEEAWVNEQGGNDYKIGMDTKHGGQNNMPEVNHRKVIDIMA